ncbi:hypothetical protein NEOKW01_0159 [Nematocida sp. AWRm80]|nr:hypothetical protein NEOKW01_0159 [Nematocida sp. AWRm80]
MHTILIVFNEIEILNKYINKIMISISNVRIFPLLVSNDRIDRRWVIDSITDQKVLFVEKEEHKTTLRSFIEQFKKSTCLIHIDIGLNTPRLLDDINNIYYSVTENTISVVHNSTIIHKIAMDGDNIMNRMINKCMYMYFGMTSTLLTDIKVRNKNNKKNTISIQIVLEQREYKVPERLEMRNEPEEKTELIRCKTRVNNKILFKLLSRGSIYFGREEIGIRLSIENGDIISTVIKSSNNLNVLDTYTSLISNKYLKEYTARLRQVHGEYLYPYIEMIEKREEVAESVKKIKNEILKVKEYSQERKESLIEGILTILNTFSVPETDKQFKLVKPFNELYLELVKHSRPEDSTKTNRPAVYNVLPEEPTGIRSLYYLINGL